MLQAILDSFGLIMRQGGWVMWPLLGLSVVGVAAVIERGWFWIATNNPVRLARVGYLARELRRGDAENVAKLLEGDRGVYAEAVRRMASEPKLSEAIAIASIETQRGRMDRFMPLLSTIVTAAPMMGILGTVLGIISSFKVLGEQAANGGPELVSQGIAEALLTTAVGLVIAIALIFPYNLFRAQIDRSLTRLETLAAAAVAGREGAEPGEKPGRSAGQGDGENADAPLEPAGDRGN